VNHFGSKFYNEEQKKCYLGPYIDAKIMSRFRRKDVEKCNKTAAPSEEIKPSNPIPQYSEAPRESLKIKNSKKIIRNKLIFVVVPSLLFGLIIYLIIPEKLITDLSEVPYFAWVLIYLSQIIGLAMIGLVGMSSSAKLNIDFSWLFIVICLYIIPPAFLGILNTLDSPYLLGNLTMFIVFLIWFLIVNHLGSKFCNEEQKTYFLGPFIDAKIMSWLRRKNGR